MIAFDKAMARESFFENQNGTISQWNPNWIDRWSMSSNFIASLTYSLVDGPYVAIQSLFLGPEAKHLTGEFVGGDDRMNALATSLSMLLPSAMSAKGANIVAKGGSQGGLNLFKWGANQTTKSTGWRTGDYMLHLHNKGTPKLNWKANYGALRREMSIGKPIFDSYILPNEFDSNRWLSECRKIYFTKSWMDL